MISNDNPLLPVGASRATTTLDRPLRDLTGASAAATLVARQPTAASEQAHIRDYINIVLKRKWLILSIAFVVTSLVAIYMYRQPSVFEAVTEIKIEQKPRSLLKTGEFTLNTGYDTTYRNTQLKLLENPQLARQVVQTLDLTHNSSFVGSQGGGLLAAARAVFRRNEAKEQNSGGALAVVTDTRAGAATTTGSGTTGEELTPEQRAALEPYENALLAGLTIEPVEKTNLVRIRYRHTDPQLAANISNTLADVFIANDRNRENIGTQTQESLLAKQIADLQVSIRSLEARRLNYMQANDLPLGDTKGLDLTGERLTAYSQQAIEAAKLRKEAQAAYEAAVRSPDLQGVPEVQENKVIEGMRDRISQLEEKRAGLLVQYTEAWPEVRKIDEQIQQLRRDIQRSANSVVTGLKSKYEAAVAKERQLEGSYLRERGTANQQSRAAIELSTLNQELETNKQLFNTANQKYREIQLSSGDRINNVTVTNPSNVPGGPVGPARARNIFVALLLSLGAGIGLAILLDHLDDTLKSIEDVDRYLHLPTLGLIPAPRPERRLLKSKAPSTDLEVRGGEMPNTALALIGDKRSPVAEAYRHLRTSLLLSSAGQPPKTVLVTSSQPSEGKTTTAVNTAVTLAQTGADVLLIDCDLRRPRIHAHFGLSNARGIANYLAGEAEIDDLIQEYPALPNLKIISSGPVPPNPAELLGSDEMRKFLAALSARFTHVIIDSPPAVSFTDAAILSTLVDGVMLVVHGGRSSRAIVRRARQQLLDVGAHIYGIVLNNVRPQAGNDYYYYGYYYSSYYEVPDDESQSEEEEEAGVSK